MLKLLIALDESDAAGGAVRWATALAQRGTAIEAVLLNAQPTLRGADKNELSRAARTRAAAAVLGPACLALRRAGIPYVERDELGDPPAVIAREASTQQCDAILMGTRRLGSLKRLVMRSVSHEVMRTAELPVTMVASDRGRALGDPMRVLVAVDGSASAERAVRHVARLVREVPRIAVDLVHVQPALSVGGTLTTPRDQLIEHWTAPGAQAAFAQAASILEPLGCAIERHVEEGEPAERINALARAISCDLVVMGARGLGRVGALVLGSVSDAVLRGAIVPVTMVH